VTTSTYTGVEFWATLSNTGNNLSKHIHDSLHYNNQQTQTFVLN